MAKSRIRRRPRLRSAMLAAAVVSLALFLTVLVGLWVQMAHGHDPALSTKTAQPVVTSSSDPTSTAPASTAPAQTEPAPVTTRTS